VKRILLLEHDATTRGLVRRILGATGGVVTAATAIDAVPPAAAFDAAIVDEVAGAGDVLDELGRVRARYPTLPVVLTGTLLSATVLLEAMRLGVAEAVPKPFTPAELRDAVGRALARTRDRGDALEFSAAVQLARAALVSGAPHDARDVLAHAHARAPLDAEAMALEGLLAEIEGRDDDAGRAYRAALALRHDEDDLPPHPLEGLARLAAYGDARPIARLPGDFRGADVWVAAQASDLAAPPPAIARSPRWIALIPLGLEDGARAVYVRADAGHAFALVAGTARGDAAARAVAALGLGPVELGAAAS
jgi:DNA-binding response OmpR family regulator